MHDVGPDLTNESPDFSRAPEKGQLARPAVSGDYYLDTSIIGSTRGYQNYFSACAL
jgi:hypothetical protein